MSGRKHNNYERFTRVHEFGAARAADFAPGSFGGELFSTMATVVETLTAMAATQIAKQRSVREGTSSKDEAHKTLLSILKQINRTANAMAIDMPGIVEKFRMPKGSSDQLLLDTARAFMTNATPLAAEFIKREMPANFLTTLTTAIANLEQKLTARRHDVEAKVEATAGGKTAMALGLDTLRKLDPIVRNKYQGDETTLAAWESASQPLHHTRRAPVKPPAEPPK